MDAMPQAALVVDEAGAVVLGNRAAQARYRMGAQGGIAELAATSQAKVLAELQRVLRTTSTSFLRLYRRDAETVLFKLKRLVGFDAAPRRLILMLEDQNAALVGRFLKVRERVKARDGALQMSLRREENLRREARKLRDLGRIEPLTGLLHGVAFAEAVRGSLVSGRGGLFFVDLDDFKGVNDRLGHRFGDAVLRETAARMKAAVPPRALCARVGGDEFAIWLPDASDAEARAVRDAILEGFERCIEFGAGMPIVVGVSVGVAIAPADGRDFDALVACADARMYADKARRAAGPDAPGHGPVRMDA